MFSNNWALSVEGKYLLVKNHFIIIIIATIIIRIRVRRHCYSTKHWKSMLCADSTTFTVKFDNFANAKAIFSAQFVATMIKIRCILQPLNRSILLLLLLLFFLSLSPSSERHRCFRPISKLGFLFHHCFTIT